MGVVVVLAGPWEVVLRPRARPAAIVVIGSSASTEERRRREDDVMAGEREDLEVSVAAVDVGFLVLIKISIGSVLYSPFQLYTIYRDYFRLSCNPMANRELAIEQPRL
jgi:hypothetical protein